MLKFQKWMSAFAAQFKGCHLQDVSLETRFDFVKPLIYKLVTIAVQRPFKCDTW